MCSHYLVLGIYFNFSGFTLLSSAGSRPHFHQPVILYFYWPLAYGYCQVRTTVRESPEFYLCYLSTHRPRVRLSLNSYDDWACAVFRPSWTEMRLRMCASITRFHTTSEVGSPEPSNSAGPSSIETVEPRVMVDGYRISESQMLYYLCRVMQLRVSFNSANVELYPFKKLY
jgi:hypothetical protein